EDDLPSWPTYNFTSHQIPMELPVASSTLLFTQPFDAFPAPASSSPLQPPTSAQAVPTYATRDVPPENVQLASSSASVSSTGTVRLVEADAKNDDGDLTPTIERLAFLNAAANGQTLLSAQITSRDAFPPAADNPRALEYDDISSGSPAEDASPSSAYSPFWDDSPLSPSNNLAVAPSADQFLSDVWDHQARYYNRSFKKRTSSMSLPNTSGPGRFVGRLASRDPLVPRRLRPPYLQRDEVPGGPDRPPEEVDRKQHEPGDGFLGLLSTWFGRAPPIDVPSLQEDADGFVDDDTDGETDFTTSHYGRRSSFDTASLASHNFGAEQDEDDDEDENADATSSVTDAWRYKRRASGWRYGVGGADSIFCETESERGTVESESEAQHERDYENGRHEQCSDSQVMTQNGKDGMDGLDALVRKWWSRAGRVNAPHEVVLPVAQPQPPRYRRASVSELPLPPPIPGGPAMQTAEEPLPSRLRHYEQTHQHVRHISHAALSVAGSLRPPTVPVRRRTDAPDVEIKIEAHNPTHTRSSSFAGLTCPFDSDSSSHTPPLSATPRYISVTHPSTCPAKLFPPQRAYTVYRVATDKGVVWRRYTEFHRLYTALSRRPREAGGDSLPRFPPKCRSSKRLDPACTTTRATVFAELLNHPGVAGSRELADFLVSEPVGAAGRGEDRVSPSGLRSRSASLPSRHR
ncbi:hypothetical protein HKX48_009045, partial [Thoreauomyces humboldtii]